MSDLSRKIQRLERAVNAGDTCPTCKLPLDWKLRDEVILDQRRTVVRCPDEDRGGDPRNSPIVECADSGMVTALVIHFTYTEAYLTFGHDDG